MQHHRSATVPALLVLLFNAVAAAQPHSGDVIVKLEAGRLISGRLVQGNVSFPWQVASATFGDTGIPGATFNPGYDSEIGALPPTQLVGLTIRKALRVWDGQTFSTIPGQPVPPRLNIIKNNVTITTPINDPGSCGVGDSLILGIVNSSGKIHEHPAYQLVNPAEGVYLLEVELWLGQPGHAASRPVSIVFNQNSGAFAQAVAWAEDRLGNPCYANCDGSTGSPVLTANDFQCFLNRYASGACEANCDGSTGSPVLTANDFQCFLNAYAAGCP